MRASAQSAVRSAEQALSSRARGGATEKLVARRRARRARSRDGAQRRRRRRRRSSPRRARRLRRSSRSSSDQLIVRAPIDGHRRGRVPRTPATSSPRHGAVHASSIREHAARGRGAVRVARRLCRSARRCSSRSAAIRDSTFDGQGRAHQPGGRSGHAPGADLRVDPERRRDSWSPACSPKGASRSESRRGLVVPAPP